MLSWEEYVPERTRGKEAKVNNQKYDGEKPEPQPGNRLRRTDKGRKEVTDNVAAGRTRAGLEDRR